MDEEIFVSLLADRIDSIRPSIEIDEDYQRRGPRFTSTPYIVEAIQGAIIMRKNPQIKGSILQESIGLEFDPYQVEGGKFDTMIRTVMKHLAQMDYESENRIDLS